MFKKWKEDVNKRIDSYSKDNSIKTASKQFLKKIVEIKYSYNFFWLGFPIIQFPQDLQMIQEIIWEVKPEVIIETGVAYGGSVIFSASILAILEACGEIEDGKVIGIEINLYPENREAINNNPLSKKITILDGSSIDEKIIAKVKEMVKGKRVLVLLDSNHTNDHVLAELRAYAPLVSVGSYIIVEDTGIENLDYETYPDRPWGKGDNPHTAIWHYLKECDDFKSDVMIDAKLVFTANPDGYLRRIK